MTLDIKAPVFAESINEATVLSWRKRAGEPVAAEELLVELETDKVVLEVVAPAAGVLTEILEDDDSVIASEALLARLDTSAVVAEPEADAEPEPDSSAASALSPAVRRLINEHEIDPTQITGTGKDGRLTKKDVEAFVKAQAARPAPPPPPPPPRPSAPAAASGGERREKMTRLRQTVATRLLQAQQNAAILTTFNEVNMAPVMELRSRYKDEFLKKHGVKLGFMSFFTRAVVQALEEFPGVNAFIDGDEIVYHDYQHIGIAVGTERGLVVPVLRHAENMSYADIEAQITDFGMRAKDGKLSPDELMGGTFTITNGGVFGSLLSTPILNPPQSGILGMHTIQKRPVVENDEIVIRPMMYIALSYDHRIVDGRGAVSFLVAIKKALEDPARQLLSV